MRQPTDVFRLKEILAKLIHQIDIFVLYPVLAMMYDDRLDRASLIDH